MANDNETVEQLCEWMRNDCAKFYFSEGTRKMNGEYSDVSVFEPYNVADRIEQATKNLSTENRRLRCEIKCMMQKYAVKLSTAVCHQACSCDLLNGLKTENKRLRDLVVELTNALETINTKLDFDPSIGFKWTIGDEEFELLRTGALVDKAREEVKEV